MAGFMPMKEKPRYHFLRVVKGWETGTAYRGGDVITLSGAETQAFLRLLRWAGAAGRVERLGARCGGENIHIPEPPRTGGAGLRVLDPPGGGSRVGAPARWMRGG